MKKTIKMLPYHLMAGFFNTKMLVALILIATILYVDLTPIINASDSLNLNINFSAISIVLSDNSACSIIFIAVLFIFSNLPVKYPQQYYALHRSGKRAWLFSQCLYVIITSLFLVMFIAAFYFLLCSGHMFFDNRWGKLITSISEGQINTYFKIGISLRPNILAEFTPVGAFIWTLSGTVVMMVIFGFSAVVLNLVINEFAGTILDGLMIFMNMLCWLFSSFFKYYFSPLSWCSVSVIDTTGRGATPGIPFAIIMWSMIIIILLLIAFLASGRDKEIVKNLERV